MKTPMRGDGGIYLRGDTWWSHLHGTRVSTGQRDEKRAWQVHQGRLKTFNAGRSIAPTVERTNLTDLISLLEVDYQMNQRRSLARARQVWPHLRGFFGEARAKTLTHERVKEYAAYRLAEGAAVATTNYELGLLKRAFKLAEKAGKVDRVPVIDSLHLSNARKGFFERAQLDAVLKHLPPHLHGVMEFAYITGWRIPSEVLRLTWDRVDFRAGWVRLDVGTTKTEDGRQFPITPELRAVLERQRERGTVPYVFARDNGKPIRDFHHVWISACRLAGLPDRIPHDLRRTAIRNLIRSGVAQVIAMKLSGHRSDTIFRRYAIVEEDMLQEAGAKLSAWTGGQTGPKANVHNSITVTALPVRK